MKKVRISLAALTLVLAVAGTTTANANKKVVFPCSQVDPDGIICTDSSPIECCETDDHQILNERGIEN